MPQDSAQENKPSGVYSPLRINWRNVVLGAVIGLLIVATGVLAFSYYDPNASPVPKVEIRKGTPSAKTATPSAKKDETADWKIITSEKLGFSFKYPEDRVIAVLDELDDGSVGFATSQEQLKQQGGPPMGTLNRKTPNENSGKEALLAELGAVEAEDVTINNATGVRVIQEEKNRQILADYYLGSSDGSKIIRIGINTSRGANPTEEEKTAEIEDFKLYEKILSTFRFD